MKAPSCSVPGCEGKPMARGWCVKHYARWRSTGHPLAVKKTPRGVARRYLDEVVLPFTGSTCLTWPYGKRSWTGYGQIGWRENGKLVTYCVHRLVCEIVNGPPPTPQHEAAHSCGNGKSGCVNPRHIYWATKAQNEADKVAHGSIMSGEKNGWAKLTEAQVYEIRALKGKEPQRATAKRFCVSQAHIWRIQSGNSWMHLRV